MKRAAMLALLAALLTGLTGCATQGRGWSQRAARDPWVQRCLSTPDNVIVITRDEWGRNFVLCGNRRGASWWINAEASP